MCFSVLSFTKHSFLGVSLGLNLDELAPTLGNMTRKLCNNCVYIMQYKGKKRLPSHRVTVLLSYNQGSAVHVHI